MPERTRVSLLDEIEQEQATKATSTCTIRTILDSLDTEDREDLQGALNNLAVEGTTIAAILKRRGFKVSSHTVQRHRRKACSCEDVTEVAHV